MKMYNKNGDEAIVEKSQIQAMVDAGWIFENVQAEKEPEVEETEVGDEVESTDEESAPEAGKHKTIRKLGKK